MLTCDKIDLLEKLSTGDYVLQVYLSDGRSPLWIYDQTRAMEFLNKEVIVVTRKDIYKGEMRDFIATFTIPTVVNVMPSVEQPKLYLEVEDNQSNVSFSEIAVGETRYSSIVYCTHCEFKSSAAARWQELTIRDKTMHTAKLRVFDYSNECAEFTGKYVLAALSRTTFGFQSNMIAPTQGETYVNPEIELAKNYVTNYLASNPIAQQYLLNTGLLGALEQYVDYEPGYAIMRMAMELAMAGSMRNITKDVDLQVIEEAIMCSYGYLIKTSVLSPHVNNIVLAMNYRWENKALLLTILDKPEGDAETSPEYKVFQTIRESVDTLLQVRKGIKL